MKIFSFFLTLLFLQVFALGNPVWAADHQVKMLNRGAAGTMVFEPSALKIEPGDTVSFIATDRGHNAETMPGMFPDAAKPFKTALNKDETVTFDVPGLYAIKCTPHLSMGMVMVIQVGDADNLEAVQTAKTTPMARRRLNTALGELGL